MKEIVFSDRYARASRLVGDPGVYECLSVHGRIALTAGECRVSLQCLERVSKPFDRLKFQYKRGRSSAHS